MGGRSSSKTESVSNTDNRQLAVQDGIGAFSEGDTNVTVTDYGAIDRSLSTADNAVNKALSTVDSNSTRAFDFGKRLQDEIAGTTQGAFDLVRQAFNKTSDVASQSVRGPAGEVADTSKTYAYAFAAVGVMLGIYAIYKAAK